MKFDSNNPFEVAKLMFEKPQVYRNEVFQSHKKKHFFLLNRRFSIQFPLVADQFNKLGVNSARALDYWQTVAQQYKKMPSFFYISAKSKENKETIKKSDFIPKEETIAKWIQINKIGIREYKECLKMNREKTLEYLQNLENQMETNAK